MAETPEPSVAKPSVKHWLLLALILVVAGALRWARIDADSFWLDEILTVELSSGHGFAHLDMPRDVVMESPPDLIRLDHARSWGSIWTQSSTDVHPPLFYMVLRAWRTMLGDSDARIRALSAVLSLAAIAMLFLSVEAMAGATPALWAAALMSLAGPQIEYAQENRSYMLMIAALLAGSAALLRIERRGLTVGRAIWLALSCLAAALTHYLSAPLLAVIAVYALVRLRGRPRNGAVLALLLAAAVFVAAWGPFALRQQTDFMARIGHTGGNVRTTSQVLLNAAKLPMQFFTNAPTHSAWPGALGASLFVLPLLLKQWRRDLLLWWMWLVAGVGSVIAGDLVRGGKMAESIRFTLAASPAAYALAALLFTQRRGLLSHAIPLVLCIACLGSLGAAYTRWKFDWRSIGQTLDQQLQSGDVLVIYEPPDSDRWAAPCHYVCMNYYAKAIPLPTVILSRPPEPAVLARLHSARRVWLYTPTHDVAAGALFASARVVRQEMFPMVGTLAHVELQP